MGVMIPVAVGPSADGRDYAVAPDSSLKENVRSCASCRVDKNTHTTTFIEILQQHPCCCTLVFSMSSLITFLSGSLQYIYIYIYNNLINVNLILKDFFCKTVDTIQSILSLLYKTDFL